MSMAGRSSNSQGGVEREAPGPPQGSGFLEGVPCRAFGVGVNFELIELEVLLHPGVSQKA